MRDSLYCMDKEIRISVRDLVEFIYREGDIDTRSGGVREEAMLEGARMHRKIQKQAGADYMAEVPLSLVYSTGRIGLRLEGRADGIFRSDTSAEYPVEKLAEDFAKHPADVSAEESADVSAGESPEYPAEDSDSPLWTIDEIKTTYQPLGKMKGPVPVHLAQARCYAYIYLAQNDLDAVCVRMTYCNLVTEKTRAFREKYSRREITEWFEETMREYERWAVLQAECKAQCIRSAKALEFPFPYREGQRDLAVHVYHTIYHGRKLYLEAPTGTGKTICTLFPSLKAVGEGLADRIFYLTSKTVTGIVALDTFRLLRSKGLHLVSVQLTAKEKICPLEKADCNPESCPRAKGHFDRVNEALYDILTSEEDLGRETIADYAARHNVCPFELSLDAALFADAVVGDYNYLFDPHARLRRFFAGGKQRERYLFLIDEAHNLVDRARDMYSAVLSKEECRTFRKEVRSVYPKLWKSLGKLVTELGRPAKILQESEETVRDAVWITGPDDRDPAMNAPPETVERISGKASAVYMEMQEILSTLQKEAGAAQREIFAGVRDSFLNFYFNISHFVMICDGMEEDYVCYVTGLGQGHGKEDPALHLYCVDPARKLAECMEMGTSSILFSATFLPIQYYKRLLGGRPEDYEVSARSAFDPGRQGIFIASDVTTRYRDRNMSQYERIARGIHNAVSERHGNYLVFFPSYRFMESVLLLYTGMFPENEETSYLVQSAHMREEERKAFLSAFENVSDSHSRIGFCVLGGIFSEGIDLRRDRLIGVIVVGTGFPQVCVEREVLRQYFDGRGDNGFDYAYRFPGMNKVLQAAGRVIRTTDDVGIVVLMDERYAANAYRRLFPAGWKNENYLSIDRIGDKIARFWDEWL